MSQQDRVIVGVNGTDVDEAPLRVAAWEARSRSRPLTVLYGLVIPAPGRGIGYVPAPNEFARDARAEVDRIVAGVARANPDIQVEGTVIIGRPQDALVDQAKHAELIVVGSRMRGPARSVLLGSVGGSVAARAGRPVLVVRGPAERIERIVVGTDQSDDARAAVAFAFDEAGRRDVPLRILSTWEIPTSGIGVYWMIRLSMNELQQEAEEELEKSIADERARHPDVQLETVVEQGHPATSLLQQASETTMLVVGSRGRGGVTGLLLGSVSQSVLHHAPCPVAVVHAAGEQT